MLDFFSSINYMKGYNFGVTGDWQDKIYLEDEPNKTQKLKERSYQNPPAFSQNPNLQLCLPH